MSDKQGAPTLPPLTGGGGNNGGSNGGAPQQTVSLQQVFANVLTSANVQQFVLASQVPGLTQVLPSGSTTNQPIGVTRIVNLSGATPRVSVVNVTGASSTVTGTTLTSPSRQNPKLVLTTSPKLVRTSIANMFVTPTSQASVQSPPAKKKSRLTEGTENATSVELDSMGYRRRIIEHKLKRMRSIRDRLNDNASELFFLHNGGNLMDYHTWKKRPPTAQYLHFMKQQILEADEDEKELLRNIEITSAAPATTTMTVATLAVNTTTTSTTTTTITTTTNLTTTNSPTPPVASTTIQSTEVTVTSVSGTPIAVSTTLPPAVAQLSQQGQVPGRPQGGRHGMVFTFRAAIQGSPVTVHSSPTTIAPALIIGGTPIIIDSSKSNSLSIGNSVVEKTTEATLVDKPATPPITSAQPIVKLVKLPVSSISPCDTVSNQEQIVEKAKQEAYVMQRIAELQREGLWSERRLPKVQEPPRPKAHWDYLLEEMVWLSTDFAQERKWKKSAAKKCARMVQKYFQEKAVQAQKAEKLEELRLKKIAGFIAKEIKTFWANVEKLVEYKQQTRLEEKRKKALDQHLNFIVDQTEKYSSWLTEGLNKSEGNQSTPASIHSSRISSPISAEKHSDDDFKPNQCSDDDEETIAKAEEEMNSNHKEEVELLKKESELPLEDLLKELPPNYLEERDKSLSPFPREIIEEERDNIENKDSEFTVASNESSDDEEDTIQEQEKLEKNIDHKQELDDLKAENEMTIDELMAKYGNTSETQIDVDSDDDTDKDEEEEQESESENETESEDETQDDSQTQSDEETAIGLKSLLEDLSDENKSMKEVSEKQNEMDSVAALAESIQPKGNTLLTTSVVTKIPFLLKHCLREYQHIGLDWLVTMYERKLNGILADEMGLGKTIQTIALLAHLACEKGNWGPHLIIVPTSVMLNWEMECKKWCPGFKILTYYGTQKERKQKRTGWTKPNAFHICITSYKLVIQDHQSFRRKKWKYLILDEAQNIKNFKSQRWQLLLNFQTQRRLLLTGTPLQNNLMELWSLMHFLMPNVFQSHREFKEWFSNPVTGMIEGNNEYNENIIRRLHKVLRPFLLRRLKCEVEKQLPKKYEHVIMCRLSKRQRYLYDDFMSRAKTKETLASGNLLSVINVLMQLRKVCNHPNLFEVRPTVSPFQMEGIDYHTASLAWSALDYDPFKHIDLSCLNLFLVDLEYVLTAFVAHRMRRLKTQRKLIEEIDSQSEPPRCPSGKIKINVRLSNQVSKATTVMQQSPQQIKIKSFPGILPTPRVGTSPLIKNVNNQNPTGQGVTLKVAGGQQLQGFSVQLVPHQGGVKAIPVGTVAQNIQSTATVSPTTTGINAQRITVGNSNTKDGPQRLTTHTYTVKHGDSVQKYQVPSFAQLVQTSTGRHIILTNPNQQTTNALSFPVMTSSGQRLTVLSKQIMGLSTTPVSVNKVISGVVTSSAGGISGRPVMRVPPLNVTTSQSAGQVQSQTQIRCGVVTRNTQKDVEKNQEKEIPKSEFYLPQLEEIRRQKRQAKLTSLADINERRCAACPLYGEDLFLALRIGKPATACQWHNGWVHCASKSEPMCTKRQFFSRTEALAEAIKSTEQIVEELKEVFDRFVIYVPAVRASLPRFNVSHPPPHKLWKDQRLKIELKRNLTSKLALFHPIMRSMLTQFPDPRLIQYDCGKLQSLDNLLRQLKSENHRVLIFTQMTRMLDVLEAFLNYHGYIYLRLDGTTKVDQRQILMERFNNDKRIFCFILSTRSGGIGVNLTGADTVVFYDSDWNPTMDAQAQDRCHRIGQTRDVHIYRLISERTVEENILKKANQKRLLGDLAIEGGNFTTAYFKSSTIQDLFDVDQSETDATARMAEVLDQNKDRERHLQRETSQSDDKIAIGALESALAAVEEDLDVQAAKTAKAEAVADLAEFDENIPVDDADNDETQVSKAEMEVQNIVSQLTPVERYAMRFVEESDGNFSAAQLAAAERELEEQKKEWELDRLRAMREEEERHLRMTDDDENPLTFTREDAQNQVNNSNSNFRRVANKGPMRPMNRRGRGRGRQISTRNTRQRVSRRVKEEEMSSDSESITASLSDTDSPNDVPNQESSSDEERKSSRVNSEDNDDEVEEEGSQETDEEDDDEDEDEKNQSYVGQTNSKSSKLRKSKNHFDLNSPRTRSRGNVKINLWTLDVSPILPESKPRLRTKKPKYNTVVDKSDEGFTIPLPPDQDAKLKMSAELLDKMIDASMNSSADESLYDEDEAETIELTDAIMSETKARRRMGVRTATKTNLRSSEREDNVSNNVLDLSLEELPRRNTLQEETLANVQETYVDGYKQNSLSHKCTRLRKYSPSSLAAAALDSNLVLTYSTRSNNKLSSIRPVQEKRVAPLKINCKEGLKICDINDTLNPRCEVVDESEDAISDDPHEDAALRLNNEAANTDSCEENYECSNIIVPKQESSQPKVELFNPNFELSEENRPLSPILNVKIVKVTRSYARSRTEMKDKHVILQVIPDLSESKQSKSSDKAESNGNTTDGIESTLNSKIESLPLKDIDDEASTSHRSSPILSKRNLKTTRSSMRFTTETKEKYITLEMKKEETKENEKNENSNAKSTSVVSAHEFDNSSLKSVIEENENEQIKLKITRSSVRSNSDTKSKESINTIYEHKKSTDDKIKNLETPIAVTTTKFENVQSLQKSSGEEEQQQIETKLTRSSIRSVIESQLKGRVMLSTDAAFSEPVKITYEGLTDASLKEVTKMISGKSQSPERKVSTVKHAVNASNLSATKLLLKEKCITAWAQNNSISDDISARDQHFPLMLSRDSKALRLGADLSLATVSKSTKTSKTEVIIPGVITRRSKISSSIEVTSVSNNAIEVSRETKEDSSVEMNEAQVENFASEANAVSTEFIVQSDKQSGHVDGLIFEQSRATRSNVQLPNPLCRRFSNSVKPILRRRPDTPMPVFYTIRPVTRSLANNNNSGSSSSSDSESTSSNIQSQLKLSPRSPRTSVDNGFLVPTSPPVSIRRSRSTTYIRMAERLAMERKEITVPLTAAKGHVNDAVPAESLTINRVIAKRRPDTPLPTAEQFSRLTRSNVDSYMPSPKSLPPISKFKHPVRRSALSSSLDMQQQLEHQQAPAKTDPIADSTDSNDNSLDSSSSERPQRTAKVVAILSLDSKNNSKNSQYHTVITSSQKTQLLNNSKGAILNNVKSSRLNKTLHASKVSGTKLNVITDDNNSGNSRMITMIDLDDEPEYIGTTDTASLSGKRVKRTRFNDQLTKPMLSYNKLPSSVREVQTIELEDDDEKIPIKRSNRCNSPTTSIVTGPPDKINKKNPVS